MKLHKFILVFTLVLQSFAQAEMPKVGPFWRVKEKAFERVLKERAILVSVRSETLKEVKKRDLQMVAGGLVSAPLERAFAIACDYPRLKQVSDHFREVRYDQKKKELFVHGVAFNYHARMTLALNEKSVDENNKVIEWRVVNGSFLGMQGKVTFEGYKKKTLMGLESQYAAEKLPLPEFFIEFALEIVLQKVAGLMRSYIEQNAIEKDKSP